MASRVAGAVLALIAAALLVMSLVATPWWSGHPTFNGAVIKAKEINISPLGARGCNTGGDGACMGVPADATFETVGLALTGVTGLLALTALVLAVLAMRGLPKRRSFAIFTIVGAMIAAMLAVVLVAVGPKIRTEAPLPLSIGLFVFFGGVTLALASSVFAMRALEATPRVQPLAPPRPTPQPAHAQPVGLDMQALLGDDALRPSSLGPEPKLGRGSPMAVQSPGGALPGPSGPLGASGSQPLFSSAPQLRPLYEMPGQSAIARPSPVMPMRAPTPIPRDQISAHAGIPTPASIEAQRPVTMSASSAPIPKPPQIPATPPPLPPPTPNPAISSETDRDLLGTRRGVGTPKSKTIPPGPKSKTIPPEPKSKTNPPPRAKAPSAAPFIGARPSVPRPAPLTARPSLAGSTLATTGAVPPPPNATVATLPTSTPTLDDDGEFDAMKTYQRESSQPRPGTPRPQPAARLLTENSGLDTDVSTQALDEDGDSPAETFESPTHESPSFVGKSRAPSVSATMETQPAPPGDDDPSGSRPRVRTDMDLPTTRPPMETTPVATAPEPTPEPAKPEPPKPEPAPEPPKTVVEEKPKLPISTAPPLPAPSETQQASSGPSPACPQCEAPMAWVEAHLRFYCKSCKMYF